ncbi:MAG: pilus assembly protein TadG-related protein [Terracidiphilus sp.]|jgi:Flp pilus assembly protein TadG
MKLRGLSFLRGALKDERGQSLVLVGLGLMCFIGLAGLSMDMGHGYYALQELQASTNAAVLAGAQAMPNTTQAQTNVQLYSSMTGGLNTSPALQGANATATFMCYPTVTTAIGVPCIAATGSITGNYNSLQVVQTAHVNLWFGKIFGVPIFNLSATGTAAMGGNIAPMNVAIVLDSSLSMTATDDDCGTGITQMNCALQGVQTLLQYLYPCSPALTTCTITNGVASGSVQRVAMFTFPDETLATYANASNCSGTAPTNAIYQTPSSTATSYTPVTATYEISLGLTAGDANGFFSDYRTADQYSTTATSRTLNPNSLLVKMVGGKSGCTGLLPPTTSGRGTFQAGAMYAAQSALTAEKVLYPAATNVLVLLSDGGANTNYAGQFAGSPTPLVTTGYYPTATKDPCQQMIKAAQDIYAAGTQVIAIAYGAPNDNCGVTPLNYDTNIWATGNNVPFTTVGQLTACVAMQNVADSSKDFYSDYTQTGSGSTCKNWDPNYNGTNNSLVNNDNSLQNIFKSVGSLLGGRPRLIPNSLTATAMS